MKRVVYLILLSFFVFTSCKKDSNPTSPNDGTATVTYAGKVYHTVKIGNQTWLKENLDVGVMIDSMQNPSNNGTIEKYCYSNDTANCNKYGGLYQWNEAMAYDTANGAKGICPTGWHLPTYEEFQKLAVEVNNDGRALTAIGQRVGTNTSGFSALDGGLRDPWGGSFSELGYSSYIWSSTSTESISLENAWYMFLGPFVDVSDSNIILHVPYDNQKFGFSIRCIKN